MAFSNRIWGYLGEIHLCEQPWLDPATCPGLAARHALHRQRLVAADRRIIDRSHDKLGKTVCDWRHCLAVVQRKPGALRNGAPFVELPEAFRTLQQHPLKKLGGDREMVDVLALVLQQGQLPQRSPTHSQQLHRYNSQ